MSIRLGQKIQSWVTTVIIASLCFPPFGFSATPPISQTNIQIGRIGNWKPNQQQFYSDVARQVQHWVENVDDGVVRVSNKSYRIASNFNPVEHIRFELHRANQQLKVGILEGQSVSFLDKNLDLIKDLRKKASKSSDVGPEIRDSLFWEGAYYWMRGNVDLGRRSIERALKIHPAGSLPEISDWDSKEIGTFNAAAFESFVDKVKSKFIRNCSVNLDIEPRDARLRVNGFSWDTRQQLWLASGVFHHIDIEAKDFISQKQLVSCQTLESKKLTVKLINKSSENKVAEHSSSTAKAIILLESNDDLLKLFLYTPGKYLDEIPLNRKIKLTSTGLGNTGETNPIVSDAMEGLLRKHELIASNLQIGALESSGLSSVFAAETKANQREKSWFESPVFWGIVGGVLVGGAITYFATRNDNTGAVNSDWE